MATYECTIKCAFPPKYEIDWEPNYPGEIVDETFKPTAQAVRYMAKITNANMDMCERTGAHWFLVEGENFWVWQPHELWQFVVPNVMREMSPNPFIPVWVGPGEDNVNRCLWELTQIPYEKLDEASKLAYDFRQWKPDWHETGEELAEALEEMADNLQTAANTARLLVEEIEEQNFLYDGAEYR